MKNKSITRIIAIIHLCAPVWLSASTHVQPYSDDAYYELAEEYKQNRNIDEAMAAYHQVLNINPAHFRASFNLANEYYKKGDYTNAISYYKQSIQANPSCAQTHFNLGLVYNQEKQHTKAVAHFKSAVEHNPNYYKAYVHWASALEKQNQSEQAVEAYKQALKLRPDCVDIHLYLGRLLCNQSKFVKSIEIYRRAVELEPRNITALLELANTLNMYNKTEEALENYYKILDIVPDNTSVLYNVAYTLKKLGRVDQAMPYYHKVLEKDPEHCEAHFSLSLAYLVTGDFANGWREYEWRWNRKHHKKPRDLKSPEWDGSDLHGKTILLHAEQGLGDTFQFIRYAKVAKEMGAYVIVAAQTPLVQLLRECDYIDYVASLNDKVPVFDTHAALLSLPYILRTKSEDDIPKEIPYLFANQALAAHWKNKLAADNNVKIGICWQGNTGYSTHFLRTAVAAKSMPLAMLRPLFSIPGVSVYNLQKMTGEEQLAGLSEELGLITFGDDFDQSHGRFMDTAALIKNLDLVITIDTSIGHLAAGLGTPVWLMLPNPPDWRWMLDRTDSPWYPENMRLFRQPVSDDWHSVVETITHELRMLVQTAHI